MTTTLDRITAPSIKGIESLEALKYEVFRLDNGIPVYIISSNFEEAIKLDIYINAGSGRSSQKGIAAATNHLITEGVGGKSSEEINEAFDFFGAFLEKESGADDAKITLYTTKTQFDKTIPLLSDVFVKADFPKEEVELYIVRQQQKLQVNEQKTSYISRITFNSDLWGAEHKYGRYMNLADYSALSRETIVDFYNKTYKCLSGAKIIISGAVSDNSLKTLNLYFGQFVVNENAENATPSVVVASSNLQGRKLVNKPGSVQASLRVGKKLFNRTHNDFFGMQVLSTLLGGYFGSRLMKNIREEKGYTYGIGSSVMSFKDGGVFVIQTDVKNEVRESALKEIEKEIEGLRIQLVDDQELNLVKNYMCGNLMRSFDSALSKAERLKVILDFGLPHDHYVQYAEKIMNIKADEVQALAVKYLDKNEIYEVVVGA